MIYINSSDAEHRNLQFKQIMQFFYAWPITTVKLIDCPTRLSMLSSFVLSFGFWWWSSIFHNPDYTEWHCNVLQKNECLRFEKFSWESEQLLKPLYDRGNSTSDSFSLSRVFHLLLLLLLHLVRLCQDDQPTRLTHHLPIIADSGIGCEFEKGGFCFRMV